MNSYGKILFESAWNASIIPLGQDTTFYAMKSFGAFDMKLAVLAAVMGGIAGQLFNWGIGHLMLDMKKRGTAKVMSDELYAKSQNVFNKYLVFLLLFSWMPLLKFLVLAAGFFNTRLKVVLPLVAAGYAFHYGINLL